MNNLLKKIFGVARHKKDCAQNRDAEIKVVGIGGCGGNVVGCLYSKHGKAVDCIYCDRDVQALGCSIVPKKIVIRENVEENMDDVRSIFSRNAKAVFLVVGIGGELGTAVLRLINRMCREHGVATILVAVTPFTSEGPCKINRAFDAIKEISNEVDMEVIYSNNHFFSKYGSLNIAAAFNLCSEKISETILNISRAYRT